MNKEEVIKLLEKNGFSCFVPLDVRSCFDIAAKRDHLLILVRMMPNIDSIREDQANELRALACALGGSAVVVGERSKSYKLLDGTVYERYGVPVLNLKTLDGVLSQEFMPIKKFFKGKFVVELDKPIFSKKLEEINVSELARKVGVSRRAIYHYRDGEGIEFSKAKKIEEILDTPLIKPIHIFYQQAPPPPGILKDYLQKLRELGFQVTPVRRGFDAVASKKESIVIDLEHEEKLAKCKAGFMNKLGDFFKSEPLFVIDKPSKHQVDGIPVISREEIKKSKSAGEVLDKVKERK
ncbi:MAG: hypothetical protein J7L23_01865 [Candidatus Diapherotrites archaeon]|nr:hypothetical protein [Candidatus Diapherotrites archaeon]